MADFTGLECDMDKSREDGVRRIIIEGKEIDLCPGCVKRHELDMLLERARDAPTKATSRPRSASKPRSDESTRIGAWCQANNLHKKSGPISNDLRAAWEANMPSAVGHLYMGDGEPPGTGNMPPHARPPGWTEAVTPE